MTDQAIQHEISAYDCVPMSVTGSSYTAQDRLQAATLFIASGNCRKVAENTNIPHRTVIEWSNQEWWHDTIAMLRLEKSEEIDAMYQEVIELGLNAQIDRIRHGDIVLTKEGDQVRKPVSLRDVATATAIGLDKLRLIRNQPTTISGSTGVEAKLEALAGKMVELSARQDAKVVSEQGKEPEKQEVDKV